MTPSAPNVSAPLPAARLIAILAADAAGYSRLMAVDDRLTVELLDAARAVFRTACAEQQGRVVDMAGDSVLLAFDSAASALRCALAVQPRLVAQANPQTGTLRLPFRIGIHLGDVIEKADGSVYGDGVNIAARLQALAEPDEVFVSQAVRDLLGAKPVARFEDAGEHALKNVPNPVRVWRALAPGSDEPPRNQPSTSAPSGNLRFGERFELQLQERRLLVDGAPAALGARAFDLLAELARQPGVLRTKNDLLEAVWPGVVVEEGNLATQISTLRKILGGEVIATIPGRGYRFTARIDRAAATPAPPAPVATVAPAAAAPPPASKLQTNLPSTLPQLVGRSEDLAALNELVAQHRLVSIIGAGGMGKTTVALHLTAGRRNSYRHGVCWVELATVTDALALPSAIAAAIGVHIGTGEPLAGLCGALMPLEMLVVLDNAEQVIDGVANTVHALLDKAPGVRFVVTTQVPLKLASEIVYRIGPLNVPQGPLPAAEALTFSAVALFHERARMADARFALTDASAPAVIDLCRQLDGVALAIELAAARAPMLGVQRLAASMGERLQVLTRSRNRMAPARQQTLRATLEWSHGFLEPAEQAVFRRLSVFAGSGSLEMIQRVVADPTGEGELDEWAVLDALSLLVDRSLVVAMNPDDAAEPRYRLLETPRLFARERLQEAGEEAALRARHGCAMAERCGQAEREWDTGCRRMSEAHRAFEPDLDNGREAFAWALEVDEPIKSAQIATALLVLLPFSDYRERLAVADRLEALIDRFREGDLLSRIGQRLYTALADNSRQRAVAVLRRIAALHQSANATGSGEPRWDRHRLMVAVGGAEAHAGNLAEAEAALVEARALFDPGWPPVRQVAMASAERALAVTCNDARAALHWTRRLAALGEAAGDETGAALGNLIDAELAAGEPGRAARIGLEAVASLAGGRSEISLAYARVNLSAALLVLDRRDEARVHLCQGWRQAPLFDLQPFCADYIALLCALDGRAEAAARIAGHADAANARVGRREPNEAAAITRATQLARADLGDPEFDRLHAEGALLRDADIAALAFPSDDTR